MNAPDPMLYLAFVTVFFVLWAVTAALLPLVWRLTSATAARVARLSLRFGLMQRAAARAGRFRDYLPVLLIGVVGVGVAAVAGDEFIDLAELVRSRSSVLQQFDTGAHDWAVHKRNSGATTFFDTMSNVGGPAGVGAIAAVALAALLLRRRIALAVYFALTVVGGGLLDLELKRFFARARPAVAEMLRSAQGYSFPSGHAMGSTVTFGALSYIAFRILPSWRWKSAAVSLAAALIAAVSLSRVYLGVHWVSDVSAGVIGGLLWVTITTVAYETWRRIRMIRAYRLKSSMREAARGE